MERQCFFTTYTCMFSCSLIGDKCFKGINTSPTPTQTCIGEA